jgi:GNAT superfamily N-acetyltransferase
METEVKVRPIVTADVPQVHRLIDAIYREYDCRLDVPRDEPHLLAPGEYVRARGGEFWVVERGGEILATVAVKLLPGGEAAELKTLYVSPALRRQGWGRRLSEMVIEYARARGRRRLVLWSDTRFKDAHRLYLGLGFRQLPETRDLQDSNNSLEYSFERGI